MTIIISRKNARKQELKYYFSGKPCKFGNFAERYVSSADCICAMCKSERDLYNKQNKIRRAEYDKLYRQNNKEKLSAQNKIRRSDKKELISQQQKEYKQRNKEHLSAYMRQWQQNRKPIIAAYEAKRKSTKLKSTPSWFEKDLVDQLYKECREISKESGIEHNVDHIVPLVSDIVCGLHCMANLRIIPAKINQQKGNRFWEDMP